MIFLWQILCFAYFTQAHIIVFSGTLNLIEDLISEEQYVLNQLTEVSDEKMVRKL